MVTKRPNTAPTCGFIHILIMIATCCCLAATLLAVGFAACMQPVATDLFAKAFASNASSPYLDEDLQALARETRDYTVSDHGRSQGGSPPLAEPLQATLVSDHGRSQGGSEAARQRIALATVLAAQHSADGDSPKRALWPDTAIDLLKKPMARENPVATAQALSRISCRLALGEDELSHLDDCYTLINSAIPVLWCCAGAALAGLAFLVLSGRRRQAGHVLLCAPAVLAAVMLALGAWAALDFNGFFGAFHGLLFPQGNWTFPAQSLLICMLPLDFWVSMAALWLAVTLAACIIAMLLGRRLSKAA